jgi:uncharacterized protein (DUF362 family)
MKKISRKDFISTSLGAIAGLMVFKNGLPRHFGLEDIIPGYSNEDVLVGMAGNNENTADLVKKAVGLAGGLDFINKGDTVLIKPNLNTGDPFPASTNPAVVYEVIKMVKEKKPFRILVGDRSNIWHDTLDCMKQNGLYDAINQAGATALPFEEDEWIALSPENAVNWRKGFSVPRTIKEADHVISIPVLKTHSIAAFSIAIKNWVGITLSKDRTLTLHRNHEEPFFGSMLAEVHLARKPSFIVTDCTRAFVEDGPTKGKAVDPGIIYATSDIVANDIVGLALLQALGTESRIQDVSVWSHPQIIRAAELGLGIKNANSLRLKYSGIDLIYHIVFSISNTPLSLFANWKELLGL